MSSMTFTLLGTPYAAMNIADGRYARTIDTGFERHAFYPYHSNGTDGQFLVDGGRIGQDIRAVVEYHGTFDGCYSAYVTDKTFYANNRGIINAPGGENIERARLETVHVLEEPHATGRAAGQMSMKVEFVFTRDS